MEKHTYTHTHIHTHTNTELSGVKVSKVLITQYFPSMKGAAN